MREHEYSSTKLVDEEGLGLDSAGPDTEESYLATACTTFRGRAQAGARRIWWHG
jgi:hypothetical protein